MSDFNPENKEPQLDDGTRRLLQLIARFFYDARSGAVPLKVQVSGGSSGGAGATDAFSAWLLTSAEGGDDATGEVGNPGKPYATAQAAVDDLLAVEGNTDGLCVLHMGQGAFGDLNLDNEITSTITLTVHTLDFLNSSIGDITWSQSGTLRIYTFGGRSLQVGNIDLSGTDGAAGAPDADGENAFSGGSAQITGVRFSSLNASGGAGGMGGDTEVATTTGGSGGAGGNVLLVDCQFGGVNAAGGAGGAGGASESALMDGGDAGNGGSITIQTSYGNGGGSVYTANGGSGGAAGTGMGGVGGSEGNGGAAGSITIYRSDLTADCNVQADAGGGAAVGAPGSVSVTWSKVGAVSCNGNINGNATVSIRQSTYETLSATTVSGSVAGSVDEGGDAFVQYQILS